MQHKNTAKHLAYLPQNITRKGFSFVSRWQQTVGRATTRAGAAVGLVGQILNIY